MNKQGALAQALAESYAQVSASMSETARLGAIVGASGQVVPLLRDTLEAFALDGVTRGKALLMAELGGIIWKQGHFDEALELLVEARALAEEHGEKPALATALYHLGELAYVQAFMMGSGDLDEALAYHQQCLALRRELGDDPGVALSLSRLGVLYERLKDNDRALALFERAVELAEEIGYAYGLIRPYTHIGGSYRRRGDLRTALDLYRQALAISQEIEAAEEVVFGLNNVGWALYRLEGDVEAALEHLRPALEIAQEIDFIFAECRCYHSLGELYFREGDGAQALPHFQKLASLSAGAGYEPLHRLAEGRIQELQD
jgi:tetratricopeptide (TPR) repeat protein